MSSTNNILLNFCEFKKCLLCEIIFEENVINQNELITKSVMFSLKTYHCQSKF